MRQLRESPPLRFLCVRQGIVTEFDWIESPRASSLDLRLPQRALSVGYRFVPQFAAARVHHTHLNVVRPDHFLRVRQRVVAGRRQTRCGCGVGGGVGGAVVDTV